MLRSKNISPSPHQCRAGEAEHVAAGWSASQMHLIVKGHLEGMLESTHLSCLQIVHSACMVRASQESLVTPSQGMQSFKTFAASLKGKNCTSSSLSTMSDLSLSEVACSSVLSHANISCIPYNMCQRPTQAGWGQDTLDGVTHSEH